MDRVHVRAGIGQDAETISALVMQSRYSFFAHPDGRGTKAFMLAASPDAIRQYLLGERHAYLVAELDDTVIGAFGVRDRRHIFHLFIAEEVRGQGIARLLWQNGRDRLLDAGDVTVNASLSAVAMYERFGFFVAGEQVERNGVVFVPMRLVGETSAREGAMPT
ncbi:GNAT family N-acetyltransferase [Uliginosibacterium sp. H3]|uniref:GNAT family N-acetyltransferase n=1 Tax=Uliginosibacterium silvisoli TaxID=3114758 RepID=A0ABU6JZD8_9RHOO|nr:GNAT family N-acetyltransferase [Uliginosibacterium sp. H3]